MTNAIADSNSHCLLRNRRRAPLLLSLLVLPACSHWSTAIHDGANQQTEDVLIRAVIAQMETAWNRGDFRGYMEGFANPDVIFVSRGEFQEGWQGTLDHYIRDYGTSVETRGTLHFYDISITILAPDTAQLISRYHLDRPNKAQDGINTRLMRKRDDKWVIVLNHVSARETS